MANFEKRRLALTLRLEGKSYSQIKSELGISKSTLSDWLHAYPLTKDQMYKLQGGSEIRIEKYRKTMLGKLTIKLDNYYQEEVEKWLPLSSRELFLAGLFLYWGEGNKSQRSTVSLNNTDPQMVKFTLYWMLNSLQIPVDRIKVFIHLYDDMDVKKEIQYWSDILGMPLSSFNKPYIKKSTRGELDQKGFGHGTCGVRANITDIKERILMSLKAISEHYTDKIS